MPGADRRVLDVVNVTPLGRSSSLAVARDLAEEVVVVVEHLELEARRLADDVADLLERLLVLAGDLDDDVLVARGDRGLAQAELVDAAVDGVLGLGDRALADAATRPRRGS